MKRFKIILVTLLVVGVVSLVGCGDDDMNKPGYTDPEPTSTGVINEIVTDAATAVSKGVSEAVTNVSEGASKIGEGISEGVSELATDVSKRAETATQN